MLNKLICILLNSFFATWCAAFAWAQNKPANSPAIAVLTLDDRGGLAADQTATLTDYFRGQLVKTGVFVVLDRAKTEASMAEVGFQQTGCTTTQCAVQIGRMLNVRKIVTGSVGKVGKTFAVNIDIIDVESSQIEQSFSKDHQGKIEGLLQVLQALAAEMAETISGRPGRAPNGKKLHKVILRSTPAGAEVFINEKFSGRTPMAGSVPHGKNLELVVRLPGYEFWQQTVVVDKDLTLEIPLERVERQSEKSSSKKWLWIAGGVGVAALGTAAYFVFNPETPDGSNNDKLPAFSWPPQRD
ncbi:MAG: PEGA domain-containing protein [bacterium]